MTLFQEAKLGLLSPLFHLTSTNEQYIIKRIQEQTYTKLITKYMLL